jgi:hypothetical protein
MDLHGSIHKLAGAHTKDFLGTFGSAGELNMTNHHEGPAGIQDVTT